MLALTVSTALQIFTSVVIFVMAAAAVRLGWQPLGQVIRRQEWLYDTVVRNRLLIEIKPRTLTILNAVCMFALAVIGQQLTGSVLGAIFGLAAGVFMPFVLLKYLAKRHLERLEAQLISGIQTLSSGVRAGLNLVQAMQLIARDGLAPMRQEMAHLLREYEYGIPLEEAMNNAARRIGSGDYRLLFAALQTHRERGGDLAETLTRIEASIREIQRLESRVQTLTAEGRATARWLGAMPGVVLLILYLLVDPTGVQSLFVEPMGKLILLGVVALNVTGFLWIRKIMSVDI